LLLIVFLLSLVEGLTEFLPVSSTGHLVVASSLLDFDPTWREPFLIVIQFGAILAVIVDRRSELLAIMRSNRLVSFLVLLFLGFAPSAILGLAIKPWISTMLKNPVGVTVAWIAGGVAILLLDRKKPSAEGPPAASTAPKEAFPAVTPKQALLVGIAQCFALWPGMSRSASTIIGGLLVGLDRPMATLFSFYVAIPTMLAASSYELYKNRHTLSGSGLPIAVGMVVSFLVAWATVRWLLKYVETHTFRPFAIYRIAAGALLLLLPINWSK
jgi:undecaprenyl-diphosphatase